MTFDQFLFRTAAAAVLTTVGTAHSADADPPQPVPIALTTLSGAELDVRGITSLDGIAAVIPAISLTPSLNSSTTPILFMRGQGLDNPSQITRDGAIGIYQDGFYIARGQALTFDLAEMDRVDVLRGPQGALYGRDTTGGVINLITQAPAGELKFRQSVDFGNRNMFRILSSLDSPSWHGLSAKLTVLASSIDGYVKNLATGSHDYGEQRQRGGRLQLHWDGLSNLRADYFLEKSGLDSTPLYLTNSGQNGAQIYFPFPYYAPPSGPARTTYRPVDLPLSTSSHTAQGLTLTWQPGAALTVKSLTGYRTLGADGKQDYTEFAGFGEATDDLYRHHQFSQELQFSGNVFTHQLSYLAGVLYFKEGGYHDRLFDLQLEGISIDSLVFANTRSEAAYAQLDWHPGFFGGRMDFTAAGRYTRDVEDAERFISGNSVGTLENGAADGAVNSLRYNRTDPTVTASFRWTDTVSTYARFATAYKAGGALETAPIGQFNSDTFQPETLETYEIGLKSSFWNQRLRVNVAAYESREKNVQYPLPVDLVTDQVFSLQQATLRGLELDVFAAPVRDLTLNASLAYLHYTIDRADALVGTVFDPAYGAGSPYAVGQNIKDLFVLQYAPKYNFTLGADYTFLHLDRRDISAHLDYEYRGSMFSDPAAGPAVPGREFDTVPAFGLLNARVTLVQETDWSHHVKVSLWGKNVLNRKYYEVAGGVGGGVTAFANEPNGAAAPSGYTGRAGAWAAPATYGVNIIYEY